MKKFIHPISLILVLSIAFGACLAIPEPFEHFTTGTAVYTLLFACAGLSLWWLWRHMGKRDACGYILISAYVLRVVLGVGLFYALPQYSYTGEVYQAGYIYSDAYERDTAAWELAQSDQPLLTSFQEQVSSDQYGGLLALSALYYRILSPDLHRPLIVTLLGAWVAALGAAALWRAVSRRWDEKLARASGWIFALFPESLLLGASQMREPFMIGLAAAAFWAVVSWRHSRRRAIPILIIVSISMLLISWRAAAALLGVLAVWFWLEYRHDFRIAGRAIPGWLVLSLAALVLIGFSWGWLSSSASWDALVTERQSGWITALLKEMGDQWRMPFVTVYGLAQPVLPPALVEPAAPLMQAIAIVRGLGWYLLAPVLIYAFFAVWRISDPDERRAWMWLAAAVGIWIVLSSARAGGDQWDNPRYRTIFIPWMALLAGWAFIRARLRRDGWLARWFAVTGVFVVLFTLWYIKRYTGWGIPIEFWVMIGTIVGVSAAILTSGLWAEVKSKKE